MKDADDLRRYPELTAEPDGPPLTDTFDKPLNPRLHVLADVQEQLFDALFGPVPE